MIVDATSLSHLRTAATIAAGVWGRTDEGPPVTTELLRGVVHAGGHVALAVEDRTVVGMSFGYRGLHRGRTVLHSHLCGVLADWRAKGYGRELKLHQRQWCLDHGIGAITWTFDPLQAANAHFNLHVLGAVGEAYAEDFYGSMRNDISSGAPSDRLFIRWDLTDPRVQHAASGHTPRELPFAPQLIDTAELRTIPMAGGADVLRCAAPPTPDPAWLPALRGALGKRVGNGWTIIGFDKGDYVLARDR